MITLNTYLQNIDAASAFVTQQMDVRYIQAHASPIAH